MRKLLLVLPLLALTACEHEDTPAEHRARVSYAQTALCNCLRTKTWLKDCLYAVAATSRPDPAWGVMESEMLHAQCLQPQK